MATVVSERVRMRFWIAVAFVFGISAGLMAWHISGFGPFDSLRFTLAESVLIGLGVLVAVIALAALVRAERSRQRQARTIAGLERFESDLARRLSEIETRLRELDAQLKSGDPSAGPDGPA